MENINTPEQIAALYAAQFRFDTDPRGGEVYPEIRNAIQEAIEADRAQRNLIECIAEALDDRGAKDAAQLVRDTDPDDDLWNNYVGPMLDSIEDDYTRMALDLARDWGL